MSEDLNNTLRNENLWFKRWQNIQEAIAVMLGSSLFTESERRLTESCDSYMHVPGYDSESGTAGDNAGDADNLANMQRLLGMIEKAHDLQLLAQRETHKLILKPLNAYLNELFSFLLDGLFARKIEFDGLDQVGDPEFAALLTKLPESSSQADFFNTQDYSRDKIINLLLQAAHQDLIHVRQGYQARFEIDSLQIRQQLTYSMADLLAERALKPALKAGLFNKNLADESDKILFLSHPADKIEIRLTPYCRVGMIGVPLSAFCDYESDEALGKVSLTLSPSFLAMAHEAGHLLGRHGFTLNELSWEENKTATMRAESPDNVSQGYSAEILADVYGCWVEGPVYAVGFQEMIETEGRFSAHEADDLHPPAKLRPLIHAHILRKIAADSKSWRSWGAVEIADALEKRWKKWVVEEWNDERLEERVEDGNLSDTKQLSEAEQQTKKHAIEIADFYLKRFTELEVALFEPSDFHASELKACKDSGGDIIAHKLFHNYCVTAFKYLMQRHMDTRVHMPDFMQMQLGKVKNVDDVVRIALLNYWTDQGNTQSAIGG